MTSAQEALDGMGGALPMPVLTGFRQREAVDRIESSLAQLAAQVSNHLQQQQRREAVEASALRLIQQIPEDARAYGALCEAAPNLPEIVDRQVNAVHVDLLPPDISYYIDASSELGHIAPDTAFYVRHIHPDPVGLIENGMGRPGEVGTSWMEYLKARDLHLELAYIDWRRKNPLLARAVSLSMRYAGPHAIDYMCRENALGFVSAGHVSVNRRSCLNLTRHWYDAFNVLRRGIGRMTADLLDCNEAMLRDLHVIANSLLRSTAIKERTIDGSPEPRWLRKRKRNILKRSIAALSELLGGEPVRLFIGQKELFIEGHLCNYKIQREETGNLLPARDDETHYSHGAARLTLLRKSDAAPITRMCIYTESVPLLDHVANLVLHIRGGCEEEVLKIGNFYDTDWDVLDTVPELQQYTTQRRPRPMVAEDQDDQDDHCLDWEARRERERALPSHIVGKCWMSRRHRVRVPVGNLRLTLTELQEWDAKNEHRIVVRDEYQPGDEDLPVKISQNEWDRRLAVIVEQMKSLLLPREWVDNPLWGDWKKDEERGIIAPRPDIPLRRAEALLAATEPIVELTEAL